MKKIALFVTICAVSFALTSCGRTKDSRPSFAFITNGAANFWEYARAGATTAGNDENVKVAVITPTEGMPDQTHRVEDLLSRGIDGIAITPIDPKNQLETLNKAAAKTILITHDADAPQSNRRVYIGMDNYQAGIVCGKTLRDAMPDGGKVMIFVGRIDQDNAKRRRQGFIDGFLGRNPDPTRDDPSTGEISSADKKFSILGTMLDQFDFPKAKQNVEDAITRHPDIGGMVGLFEYNPPMIIEALKPLHKLGKIKIMGFDESFTTLQGIKDGTVVATVVQNPYQYGYKSIHMLNELHKGNNDVIPKSGFIDIPWRVITKSNVDEFWTECRKLLGTK
jgi:ribose transport system substrate-binding protein